MSQFRNKLSAYQIKEISRVTGLEGDNLKLFIENIEFQLNTEGVLPTDQQGNIDFNLKVRSSNNYKDCRERIKDISRGVQKLINDVRQLNEISYRHLSVSSRNLGFKASNDYESDGFYEYDEIYPLDYLNEMSKELLHMLAYYEPRVSAPSGRVTESLHVAWCFGLASCGGLPNKKDMAVKLSEGNAFLEVVAIVTSWNFETAKKNVGNATWYKQRKSAFEKGLLKMI